MLSYFLQKMKKNLSLMPRFSTPEVATFKHLKNRFPLEIITIKELCMDLQTLKYAYFLPISNDYNLAHRLYVMPLRPPHSRCLSNRQQYLVGASRDRKPPWSLPCWNFHHVKPDNSRPSVLP